MNIVFIIIKSIALVSLDQLNAYLQKEASDVHAMLCRLFPTMGICL